MCIGLICCVRVSELPATEADTEVTQFPGGPVSRHKSLSSRMAMMPSPARMPVFVLSFVQVPSGLGPGIYPWDFSACLTPGATRVPSSEIDSCMRRVSCIAVLI